MNKPFWTAIGFGMFFIGILSLILAMVGLKLSFINFIYSHGVLTLLIQLILLFGGMVIMYVARTSEED